MKQHNLRLIDNVVVPIEEMRFLRQGDFYTAYKKAVWAAYEAGDISEAHQVLGEDHEPSAFENVFRHELESMDEPAVTEFVSNIDEQIAPLMDNLSNIDDQVTEFMSNIDEKTVEKRKVGRPKKSNIDKKSTSSRQLNYLKRQKAAGKLYVNIGLTPELQAVALRYGKSVTAGVLAILEQAR